MGGKKCALLLLGFSVSYHLCDFAGVKSPQNTEFLDSLYYLLLEGMFMVTSVFKTEILKQIYYSVL